MDDDYDRSTPEQGIEGEEPLTRRDILGPVVKRVVDALGGYEGDVYRLGDEAYGCLKDLKRLWRKDDTDDERTVARLFWETRVLINDIIPILLETAGKGLVEDKRAIACADLLTAMTWPIDMAEELKELDDELDKYSDYTQLLQSHLHYKAALLKPGVMQALFCILLPPLAKHHKERTPRDGQIVHVVLYLFRNLAFIKDLPINMHLSSDQAEFSALQTKLVRVMSETHTFELLFTIASNTDNDPLFNTWNTLVLEIFYLLLRGTKPTSLTLDPAKQPQENLRRLLATEDRRKKEIARKASSRHSRFGTTIAVSLNPNKKPKPAEDAGNEADVESTKSQPFVLHRQQAIKESTGTIWDMKKKQTKKRDKVVDELSRTDNLSPEAKIILRQFAVNFLDGSFNPFLSALIKDIRSERAKITNKDNLRLLYVTKWFLEFFLAMRAKEKDKGVWRFDLVAEVTERTWIVWVLKRMREASEEKPKLWTELQAGIECLTQLLLLIDNMASSDITDPVLNEAADILQQQLIYNGEVLDIAFESLKTYKEGTQSLAYLDSSVYLGYSLLRMLERWGKKKSGEMYVRKKKTKGKSKVEIPDVEDEEVEEEKIIHETMFTFEAFEMKFAQTDINHTLLAYLSRYRDFSSSEHMKRVVNLLHRQAVRAKAEGLFFKVSTLNLFKTILADQRSFPREQPYKDLINLINFILRRFFKALEGYPFLAIEAFFPKNRGHWKVFSSYEPESSTAEERAQDEDARIPADIHVKKGHSWSEEVGIVVAVLVEAGQGELVDWTKEILTTVIAQRNKIIETDVRDDDADDEDHRPAVNLDTLSSEALAKMQDYRIPCTKDEHANAVTKNPQLKLLFRLCKFYIENEDADELEWYIPAAISPGELRRTLTVINQFLDSPIDLNGKKASQLLAKTRRRRRRTRMQDSDQEDEEVSDDEEPRRRKKTERKKKEEEQYKSAQFIEDSDEEYGDMEAFLAQEKVRREKAAGKSVALGEGRSATIKSHGTKKRRKKAGDKGDKKRRKGETDDMAVVVLSDEVNSDLDTDIEVEEGGHSTGIDERPQPPPPLPKAKPIYMPRTSDIRPLSSALQEKGDHQAVSKRPEHEPVSPSSLSVRRKGRLIVSDEDE
ncbi:timeless protein-domain-containing protein [Desarmillaria ectypa]|nr:timeless protein-domain-containing protein [Desarmillaria ectypa]